MGFSVLSLVEIIYFVTLRPYHRKMAKGKAEDTKPLHVDQSEKKVKKQKRPPLGYGRQYIRPKIAWMTHDATGVDHTYVPFPYTE